MRAALLALVLGQTFLGDVFRPGTRATASFPTPSIVNRGGILFDGDAGVLRVSNGTTWDTLTPGSGSGGSGNFAEVSVVLASSGFAYSQAVTGQAWVTASSNILCSPMAVTTDGQTVETYAVAGLETSVSTRVAGVGFTLHVANPRGASGTFRFSCSGG